MLNTVRITFRLSAGPHERFTESFARSLLGQRPVLNVREYDAGPITEDYGDCLVVGAEVIEDGRAVLVTYETEHEVPVLDPSQLRGFSFSVAESLRRLTDGQP